MKLTHKIDTWWWFGAVMLLGAVVRLLGPVRSVALGHSDAYAHLQFLKDWIEMGHLRHSGYPPGFYWVIGLPTHLLQLDPYYVIRFGGVFFGVALICAVYLLGRRCFCGRAGLWAAFLVSAFPAFWLLQKTGVGAYPSPLGLVLTVLMLWSWDKAWCGASRWFGIFLMGLVLLALSVPVMLIDVAFLLFLDFMVRKWRREIPIKLWALSVSVLVFVGAGLVGVYKWGYLFEYTFRIIAGISTPESGGIGFVWQVILAYISPERGLPPSWKISALSFLVLGVLGAHAVVLWRTNSATRMLVVWSLLAWAQAVFGMFQFSLYIRAGWHLLIAIALLGGWLIPRCLDSMTSWRSCLVKAMLIASVLITLVHPPASVPHLSSAENDLVMVLRSLSGWADGRPANDPPAWIKHLPDNKRIVLWTRAYNVFPGHQGDPVWAFLENTYQIEVRFVDGAKQTILEFDEELVNIVLMDDMVGWDFHAGMMRFVNPELTEAFKSTRKSLSLGSLVLRKSLAVVRDKGWSVHRYQMPEGLELYVVSNPNNDDI